MSGLKKKINIKKSSSNHGLLAVVFVVLFAGLGVYLVLFANAENSGGIGVNMQVGPQASQDHPAGSTFDLPVKGGQSAPGKPGQAVVMLSFDRNDVKYLGYTCGTVTPCSRIPTYNGGFLFPHHHIYAFLCFDVPFNNSQTSATLFTVHLKAVKHLPGPYEVNWLVLWSGYAPGSCSKNRDASNVAWRNGLGGCGGEGSGQYPSVPCDTGSEVAFGPYKQPGDNPSNNDDSSGDQGDSNGSGAGGSGGSTAKTPNDKPNNVPSSSDQGNAKQPDLNPSPFFDGKEYKSGSATDTLFGGVFSRSGTGGAAGTAQAIVAAIVLVGIAVGSYIWWRKHHKV